MTAKVVVAAIGSEYRRDDGAGRAVAERIDSYSVGVCDVGPIGEPLDLLGRWDDADLAIVIDTVSSGVASGTVTLIDLVDGEPPSDGGTSATTSTHGIGLIGTLRIARAVHRAPRRVLIVAIEGADFGLGVGLSPAVERAVDIAARKVAELMGDNFGDNRLIKGTP